MDMAKKNGFHLYEFYGHGSSCMYVKIVFLILKTSKQYKENRVNSKPLVRKVYIIISRFRTAFHANGNHRRTRGTLNGEALESFFYITFNVWWV